jgi:primase-polymerase (primpol)-like protein
VNVAAIPAELRELDRWVVWRWEPNPNKPKPDKPPYPPHAPAGPKHASNATPADWGTFEQAVAVVERGEADGIGFALEPPYVGVDLDAELPEAEQHAILLALDTYSERSPSGTGHHAVLRAILNGSGRHPTGIGVFQNDRFFYFSGEHATDLGLPLTIEDRQEQLDAVLEQYLPKSRPSVPALPPQPVDLDDRELLERARAAKNGATFERLWAGDTSGHDGDDSRTDAALCSMLAYWTGRDPDRIDRLFRASGLMREKWDDRRSESTYGAKTIAFAIEGCSKVYSPSRGGGKDLDFGTAAEASQPFSRNVVPPLPPLHASL